MGPIVVSAFALKSGRNLIKVSDCNGSQEAAALIQQRDRHAGSFRHVEERQTAVYPDLPSARSGVMRDFGMGWFNLARKELDNPPVALGMGAPPRTA